MGTAGTGVASGEWQTSPSYGSPQQRSAAIGSVALNNVAAAQQQHHTVHESQGVLSKSPMPEFWCSILYFELDTQVYYDNVLLHILQKRALESSYNQFLILT